MLSTLCAFGCGAHGDDVPTTRYERSLLELTSVCKSIRDRLARVPALPRDRNVDEMKEALTPYAQCCCLVAASQPKATWKDVSELMRRRQECRSPQQTDCLANARFQDEETRDRSGDELEALHSCGQPQRAGVVRGRQQRGHSDRGALMTREGRAEMKMQHMRSTWTTASSETLTETHRQFS